MQVALPQRNSTKETMNRTKSKGGQKRFLQIDNMILLSQHIKSNSWRQVNFNEAKTNFGLDAF